MGDDLRSELGTPSQSDHSEGPPELGNVLEHFNLDAKVKKWVHDYNLKPKVHKEEAELVLSPKAFKLKQVYSLVYKDPRPAFMDVESQIYSLNRVRELLEMALHGGNTEILNKAGFHLRHKSDLMPCHSVVEVSMTEAA